MRSKDRWPQRNIKVFPSVSPPPLLLELGYREKVLAEDLRWSVKAALTRGRVFEAILKAFETTAWVVGGGQCKPFAPRARAPLNTAQHRQPPASMASTPTQTFKCSVIWKQAVIHPQKPKMLPVRCSGSIFSPGPCQPVTAPLRMLSGSSWHGKLISIGERRQMFPERRWVVRSTQEL